MSDLPNISEDFIIEGRKLVKTSKKLGGPYSITERVQRRQKVYELHFLQSVSGIKTAEMLNVNYNTIRGDIQFWWDRLNKEWSYHEIGSLVIRQMDRLESQRMRLFGYLEKEPNITNKLSIEKQIFDIDSKINQFSINATNIHNVIMDGAVKVINKWSQDKKLGQLLMRSTDLVTVADEDLENIRNLIKKSKSKIRNR